MSHGALHYALAGVRGAMSVPLLVLIASYIGFGGLLHGVGFPLLPGMLSTIFIWALPAQVILIGGLAAGTALPAIALAVGLSSIRLLPMAVALAPFTRASPLDGGEFCASHFVAMTMWVEGMRLLPKVPVEGRPAYTLAMGATYVGVSTLATGPGSSWRAACRRPSARACCFSRRRPSPSSWCAIPHALDWMALAFGLASDRWWPGSMAAWT